MIECKNTVINKEYNTGICLKFTSVDKGYWLVED